MSITLGIYSIFQGFCLDVGNPRLFVSVDLGIGSSIELTFSEGHVGQMQPYESGYKSQKYQYDKENKF